MRPGVSIAPPSDRSLSVVVPGRRVAQDGPHLRARSPGPGVGRHPAAPGGRDLSIISTEGASALPKAVANNVEQLDLILRSLVGTGLTDMVGGHLPGSDASADPADHSDRANQDGGAPVDVVEQPAH